MVEGLHLSPRHRKEIVALLHKHLPGVEVWAHGSRVNGRSHDGSDLDLVLHSPQLAEIDASQLAEITESFRKSTVPFLIDARDWVRLPESFHWELERAHVVMVEREERDVTGKTIADFVNIVMGQSPPGDTVSGGVGLPLLNGPTEFGPHHPTPIQFTTDARKIAHPGDLLFCVRGSTTGRMNWADKKYAIGRGVAAIRHRCASELQPFVRAVIEFELPKLLVQATGSTFPNVSASQLASIPYPNLSAAEQRAIAHILGTLDDKIELNRRMNETLEAMARALFKSWFVDFDPVRAKMAGRDTGLPKHLADLFPDRLVESEVGEIPEGWEVMALDTIADFRNGLALQRYRPQTRYERLPVVKIAQLRSGKTDSGEWATSDICPEFIIDDGDVVFSWSGSLMVMVWCSGRAALNQHLFKVTSTRFPKWFFLHNVRSHLANFQTIAAGKATTMGHIKRHHLSDAMCTVPDSRLLAAADGPLSAIFERSLSANIQSRTLASLRDTLLPELCTDSLCECGCVRSGLAVVVRW